MHGPSDRELVERTRAGDRDAFGQLVERYQDPLFRYALHMGFGEDRARDILQDAFVRAWRHLDRCGDPDRFDGWLFRITSNLCRTAGRRAGKRPTVDVEEMSLSDPAPGPDEQTEADLLRRRVRVALESLPEDQRETMVLFYLHGRSVREISEVLEVSGSAVKMRLMRARDALRAELEPVHEEVKDG